MKKKLTIGVVILLIIGIAGFFAYNKFRQPTVTNNLTEKSISTVRINNFKFTPSEITAKPGETITVTNEDIVSHTITSDEEGLFDTGLIGKDQTQTFTAPEKSNKYPFHCAPHPFMKGTLIVKE